MRRSAIKLLPLALLLSLAGCFDPSFEGPGGFSCAREGRCPEGYVCCARNGQKTCEPEGKCLLDLGVVPDTSGDQGKKDQGKKDQRRPDKGKPDKALPQDSKPTPDKAPPKDSKPTPDKALPQDSKPFPDKATPQDSKPVPDKATPKDFKPVPDKALPKDFKPVPDKASKPLCNYTEQVVGNYNGSARQFAMFLNPKGVPQVLFAEAGAMTVAHASQDTNWKKTQVTAKAAGRVAGAVDGLGVLHAAFQTSKPTGPQYLYHTSRAANGSTWAAARKVSVDEIGESVDMSASGTQVYITATLNSTAKRWTVFKVNGTQPAYTYLKQYDNGLGNPFSEGRVAAGATHGASAVWKGSKWTVVGFTHTTPKPSSVDVPGGASAFPMDLEVDSAGLVHLGYAKDVSSFRGPLWHSHWTPGDSLVKVSTQIQSGNLVSPPSVSIALDSAGEPHLTWMQFHTSGWNLKWVRRNSGKWQPHQTVSSGNYYNETQLAVDPKTGYVHITYPTMTGGLYHVCKIP